MYDMAHLLLSDASSFVSITVGETHDSASAILIHARFSENDCQSYNLAYSCLRTEKLLHGLHNFFFRMLKTVPIAIATARRAEHTMMHMTTVVFLVLWPLPAKEI